MLHDMTIFSDTLHWSDITPIFDPVTDLDLITEFDFLLNCARFPQIICNGAAYKHRTPTPPDTWDFPTVGLTSVHMLRPNAPGLVLFPDVWNSNIPWYFCFAWVTFSAWKSNIHKNVYLSMKSLTIANLFSSPVSTLNLKDTSNTQTS